MVTMVICHIAPSRQDGAKNALVSDVIVFRGAESGLKKYFVLDFVAIYVKRNIFPRCNRRLRVLYILCVQNSCSGTMVFLMWFWKIWCAYWMGPKKCYWMGRVKCMVLDITISKLDIYYPGVTAIDMFP